MAAIFALFQGRRNWNAKSVCNIYSFCQAGSVIKALDCRDEVENCENENGLEKSEVKLLVPKGVCILTGCRIKVD